MCLLCTWQKPASAGRDQQTHRGNINRCALGFCLPHYQYINLNSGVPFFWKHSQRQKLNLQVPHS